jgi:hypothetical protein
MKTPTLPKEGEIRCLLLTLENRKAKATAFKKEGGIRCSKIQPSISIRNKEFDFLEGIRFLLIRNSISIRNLIKYVLFMRSFARNQIKADSLK